MADTWSSVIGRLGVPTSDGRVILAPGYTHRELPLPLSWQRMSDEAHDGSVVVGRILAIEPDMDGLIHATGEWLDESIVPEVAQARELADKGVVGPSMDAGGCSVEWMETGGGYGHFDDDGYMPGEPYGEVCLFTEYECAGATLVSIPAFTGMWLRSDGVPALTAAGVRSDGWSDMPVAEGDPAWDGAAAADRVATWAGIDETDAPASAWDKYARAFLWQDPAADAMTKGAYKLGVADVIDGELRIVPRGVYAVAGVLNGARGGADIPQDAQDRLKGVVTTLYGRIAKAYDDKTIEAPFALVASAAAPAVPPLAWFADPKLTGPTPITITDDGRVFGHVAAWGVCHIGLPGCVTPPESPSGYAYFRTGATMTDGGEIATGKLTVGGGHADGHLGYTATADHYDNHGTSVATVAAGEDEFGIWVAGAVLPDATAGQIEALRQSPLSGDWRDIGGSLELVAAHGVNTPGFPVPRPRAVVASSGRQLSLVAAGLPRVTQQTAEEKHAAYVQRLAGELAAQLDLSAAGSSPTAFSYVDIPDGFDIDAGDLRAAFAAAGVAWPTIVGTMGGVEIPLFEISDGCVRAALQRARGDEPMVSDMQALSAAQQKLAQIRLSMATEG